MKIEIIHTNQRNMKQVKDLELSELFRTSADNLYMMVRKGNSNCFLDLGTGIVLSSSDINLREFNFVYPVRGTLSINEFTK